MSCYLWSSSDWRLLILVGRFRVCLLSRVDICSLYWGIICVWASGLFVLARISLNRGSFYRRFPIHFIVTLVGLISIVRYTEDSVIKRFVKSRFHCCLICFLIWVFFLRFCFSFLPAQTFYKKPDNGKKCYVEKREKKKNTNPTKKGMWPSCLLLVNPSMLWIVQGSIHLRKCQTNHTYKNLIYKKNVYYSYNSSLFLFHPGIGLLEFYALDCPNQRTLKHLSNKSYIQKSNLIFNLILIHIFLTV